VGAEDHGLNAAGEQRDACATRALGRRQRRRRRALGLRRHRWEQRFPGRQGPGQALDEARLADQTLQSARLIEARARGGEPEQARVAE